MTKINKWLKKLLQAFIRVLNANEGVSMQKTLQEDRTLIKSHTEGKGVNLLIIRDTFTKESTMGELFLNGERFCDTLELPWLNNKKSVSCIPAGSYKARLRLPRESATRDYIHLIVKDVKNRSYILFHRGNTASDTRGCILVGYANKQDYVSNSTLAMDLLIKEILNLGDGYNINLIIKNK